jgi:hypothetical protein
MISCPNCKTENRQEAHFCRQCAQKLDNPNTSGLSNNTNPIPSLLIGIAVIGGGLLVANLFKKKEPAPPKNSGRSEEKMGQKDPQEKSAKPLNVPGLCEIKAVVATMNITVVPFPMTVSHLHFEVKLVKPESAFPLTKGPRSFNIPVDDVLKEFPGLKETKERREDVDSLRQELIQNGWKPIEHGEYWYSYRFKHE